MNILLTSVGRRSYMVKYFKEALQSNGKVHVANSSALSPAFCEADAAVVTPLIYDKKYIPFLKEYCITNNINVIIPLFDIDLPILASHKEEFKKIGIIILVSDISVINICNDKWLTYLFLKKHGFFTPVSYLDINIVLEEINRKCLKFPIIIKPRWGMGSIGMLKVENKEELKVCYKKIQHKIFNSYLKYESQQNIEQSILIQECLIGQEYGFDIINNLQGHYKNAVIKKKLAMRSGETDCAITVNWSEGKKIAKRLSMELGHIGNLDVDIFEVNGVPYILEMNARFGGGYPFSHLAGINLPKTLIDWVSGKEPTIENLDAKIGIIGQKDIGIVCLQNIDNKF